ncbi:MAG: ROK family protein [Ferruginibacter sp.]
MKTGPNLTLGVDIGGSHITVGLVEMDERRVIEESIIRSKVNCHGTADEILNNWAKTICEAQREEGESFTTIGIAMPGPFNYEDGICLINGFDKYESLYGINIRTGLAKRTGIAPKNICFRNDAEAFLEGELFCGAARGFAHAIGITLGTGLGSAMSHGGFTRDAEMSVLQYRGDKIEELVSTRGIIKIYKELTGITITDVRCLADLYYTNPSAEKAFHIFAGHLAWFLEIFIRQESPEVLVIGGNIANAYALFMDEVIRQLRLSGVNIPKIAAATLGENAPLIGGACKLRTVQNDTTTTTQ